MTDRRQRDDRIVASLRSAVNDGRLGLDDVPGLIKKVLRGRMWRDRIVAQTGERACFDSFAEFVAAQPLEGLGTNLKTLQRLCSDDREALDLIDRAVQGKRGGSRKSGENDVTARRDSCQNGNSQQYALRRLRSARPDLHTQVLAGDISPHRAMQLAGFRKPTISVPLEPVAAANALARKMDCDALEDLISAIRSLMKGVRKK